MTLGDLLSSPRAVLDQGTWNAGIDGLSYDSRKVRRGDLFFALPGVKVDGVAFARQAIEAGAAAVVSQSPAPNGVDASSAWVRVPDAREAMGRAAHVFHGQPSESLPVVGITGTNGKTTIAFLVQHLVAAARHRCGLIGTVRYDTGLGSVEAPHTTPESVDVHALLAEMLGNGCRAAAMEVSSHGLAQHRVAGVRFRAALFTNLTRDHLDYHGTMEDYFAAKRRLFEIVEAQSAAGGKPGTLVINRDDVFGQRLLKSGFEKARVVSYGLGVGSDLRAVDLRQDLRGTQFQLEWGGSGRKSLVRLPFIGKHNVSNALAAMGAAQALDLNLREAVGHLASAPQVPGRLELVPGAGGFRVFVDYAHTPDALENVLRTLREIRPGRIITVFGCGGDRDNSKRPLMGAAVSRLSDLSILTSDNPRTEDPESILDQVAKGMTGTYRRIADRHEAIKAAIALAQPGDAVLIAGKGHETYQEINGVRHPFDDRKVARRLIEEASR